MPKTQHRCTVHCRRCQVTVPCVAIARRRALTPFPVSRRQPCGRRETHRHRLRRRRLQRRRRRRLRWRRRLGRGRRRRDAGRRLRAAHQSRQAALESLKPAESVGHQTRKHAPSRHPLPYGSSPRSDAGCARPLCADSERREEGARPAGRPALGRGRVRWLLRRRRRLRARPHLRRGRCL
jgi:hypothetical protein